MHRRLTIVIAALALAIAVPTAAQAAAPASAFTGTWESTDIPDGSHQTLVVSSGARPSVVYQDFYASGCDNNSNLPADHWTAAGKGFLDGDTLWVSFHKSGCGTFIAGGYEDFYTYDSGSDTIVDSFGIVWTRTT